MMRRLFFSVHGFACLFGETVCLDHSLAETERESDGNTFPSSAAAQMPAAPCTQKSKKGSEKQKQMYKKDASRTVHIKLKKGSQKQISKKHARIHKT